MAIPILILAAGRSSRMRGRDKLLEPVGAHTLIRHQALTAMATDAQVWVTVPTSHPRGAEISDLPIHTVEIPPQLGMGDSLRHGVNALPTGSPFMVHLADIPGVTHAHMIEMMQAFDGTTVLRATSGGKPGHPIIFPSAMRPLFNTLHGDTGAKSLLTGCKLAYHPLRDGVATTDLDTPEDWAEWRKTND